MEYEELIEMELITFWWSAGASERIWLPFVNFVMPIKPK